MINILLRTLFSHPLSQTYSAILLHQIPTQGSPCYTSSCSPYACSTSSTYNCCCCVRKTHWTMHECHMNLHTCQSLCFDKSLSHTHKPLYEAKRTHQQPPFDLQNSWCDYSYICSLTLGEVLEFPLSSTILMSFSLHLAQLFFKLLDFLSINSMNVPPMNPSPHKNNKDANIATGDLFFVDNTGEPICLKQSKST